MTGPEHYREAERLIKRIGTGSLGPGKPTSRRADPDAIAEAQVHATLALAAATAVPSSTTKRTDVERWIEAIGGTTEGVS